MMRPFAFLGLCAMLIGSGAMTAPPSVEKTFGNTIVSTYPDGRTAELWLQADGAYTGKGRRGERSSGRWRVTGERLCLKQSRPISAPFSFCTVIPDGGVGADWSTKAVTGELIRVNLVKGSYSGQE